MEKNKVFKPTSPINSKAGPVFLDGTYEFFYKNGQKFCTLQYKNGIEVGRHIYYTKKGRLDCEFNFDVKVDAKPYTYYYKEFNKQGELKYYGYWCQLKEADWVILPMGMKPSDLKRKKE